MKFVSLFKKEIRELMTLQTIVGVLVSLFVFLLIGQFVGNVGKEMSKQMGSVVVADRDDSNYSQMGIKALENAGFEVTKIPGGSEIEMLSAAETHGHSSVLVIPEGFGEGLGQNKTQQLQVVTRLKSFSIMGGQDSSAGAAAEVLQNDMKTRMLSAAGTNPEFMLSPVTASEITVVNGKSDNVNAALLQSFSMQQTIFIPIIVFILITFASQLNASAIANEKGDKTLETLLSAPVSRLSVLGAKMCASGLLSLLMAAVYMIGFSTYMGGVMGGAGGDAVGSHAAAQSLQALGLQLSPLQYLAVGIQLFLTIMIALAASMILGALAKDVKSAASLMMPLMFLAMIPYFVTMFTDVDALPAVGRVLLYLIPFTHTFTATSNLLFGNYAVFYGGMVYQAVLLAVVLMLAVRIFSTDKIFTMTLGGHKSRRTKKA